MHILYKLVVSLFLFSLSACMHLKGESKLDYEGKGNDGLVFYQIFVRSFQDSNGDGIGDLNGITSRLGYLEDLGVTAIWLTPIFKSPSYHGYDATDYYSINPDYGSKEDLARLLGEAHRRNIKVILDLVLNHTSSEHPWFLESASSATSSKRGWYIWSDSNPGWTSPWGEAPTWHFKNDAWYYGVFWSGMPDLNFRNLEVKTAMFAVAHHWLDFGVDGFRLDATKFLVENGPGPGQFDVPETHALLNDFSQFVMNIKPDALIIAENWSSAKEIAPYFSDVPMNFNFPLSDAILKSVQKSDARFITQAINEMQQFYPANYIDAPFLTNHDQVRVATQLENKDARLKNAAAILLTLPGNPFIYYGEEIGMLNGITQNDEAKRTPMLWDDTEHAGFSTAKPWFGFSTSVRNERLLKRYKSLISARRSSIAIQKGVLNLLNAPTDSVVAWISEHLGERVIVIHNLSDTSVKISLSILNTQSLSPLWVEDENVPERITDGWVFSLQGRSSGVWRLKS